MEKKAYRSPLPVVGMLILLFLAGLLVQVLLTGPFTHLHLH